MATWASNYPGATDQNLYAIYRSLTTGEVWNGTAMVTWVDADIASYDVPATFDGGGFYRHTIPDDLPASDTYRGEVRVRAGGAPAVSDTKLSDEFEFAWNGDTASEAPGPGDPAGAYADIDDLEDWFGAANITAYSDLENTGTRDTARIQKWLDKADAWIDLAFKRAGRTTPITDDADDFSALSDVAAEWAGAMLAKGRGDLSSGFSKPDGFDDSMDGHIERAQARLNELVAAWAADTGTIPPGAVSTVIPGPEVAGATVDPFGNTLPCAGSSEWSGTPATYPWWW